MCEYAWTRDKGGLGCGSEVTIERLLRSLLAVNSTATCPNCKENERIKGVEFGCDCKEKIKSALAVSCLLRFVMHTSIQDAKRKFEQIRPCLTDFWFLVGSTLNQTGILKIKGVWGEGNIDMKKEKIMSFQENQHTSIIMWFAWLVCILPTTFVFLCFHIREIRLDGWSHMIISAAVDSLTHHKMDIIKTGANNGNNYLQFTPHMATLSRHEWGCFQVTPVVVVGGLEAPVPHPAEIICSSLVSILYVTLVIPGSCPAEVFAQSLCIKEQGSQGWQNRNNG